MAAESLPLEVRRLLAGPIETMEHLELLLLLARSDPQSWSAERAAATVKVAATFTEARLRDLVSAGLAVETADPSTAAACFAYGPVRPWTRGDVALLLDMYNTRPVTLIRALYDRKTLVTKSFADAFRIRKEES